jgi:hypothetical protein
METFVKKSIEVKALDSAKAAEIVKALNEEQPQTDGSKVIRLDFQSAKGEIPVAISLIDNIHKSDTECIINCSGDMDLASVITLSGGKFGERKAESAAVFTLSDSNVKAGKKRTALTAEEKNALEILGVLSGGKRSKIKAFMLSGAKATAAEMKSLGLIDIVNGGFIDKYATVRAQAKATKKAR